MKENKQIEKKIRLNAMLIYIVVAFLCAVMFFYLYGQKESISSQKQNIEQNRNTLTLTNKLIFFVNQAQVNANLYIVSKEANYIFLFKDYMYGVQSYIDSLKTSFAQGEQKIMLDDIEFLLNKKVSTVSDLNLQFDHYNLIDSISNNMQKYELMLLDHAVHQNHKNQITTIVTEVEDTVKKKFFKRLAEAFVPDKKASPKSQEVVIVEYDSVDVAPIYRTDSLSVLSDLLNVAHKTGKKYRRQIADIEKQVATLMISDHEISMQLSNLLLKLHQQTIFSTTQEIQKSEKLIRRNYITSIIGSLISLALVLTLIIFIIRNTTKTNNMLIALEKANWKTKETFESRHKLLLSVSHDVKTPTNSILGYLELWKHGYPISSTEVNAMQYSAKHILELLENLLDYSRLDQGLMKSNPVNFNLYALCSEMVELCKPLALQKKLSFDVQLNIDEKQAFCADALKIKQIVINILSNAMKYTSVGGVQFHVHYKDECVEFEIKDTGKGIPPEFMDEIFDAFTRVEENNALASGNGFGLFVAKGLTDLLGGTITVHSKMSKGTQMHVRIPVQLADTAPVSIVSKRILAVDDDVVFLSMLEKMLSLLGHRVDLCQGEGTCEALLSKLHEYDVLLTDADMITFSGMDVMRKIKEKGLSIPVVLMSGREDLDEEKVKEMGFSHFLQKPVTIASLQQLFGGNPNVSHEFLPLEELFEGDMDLVHKILHTFVEETEKHLTQLEEAMVENHLEEIRKICHKMLPMFKQLKVEDAVPILSKINASGEEIPTDITVWKRDISHLINISRTFIEKIRAYLVK